MCCIVHVMVNGNVTNSVLCTFSECMYVCVCEHVCVCVCVSMCVCVC